MEAFRFGGPVLGAILDLWTADAASRRWIRELVLEGLVPATATLQDAIRVPLLLEEILGSFEPELYPELDNVVDKFCFHCGTPRVVSPEKMKPKGLRRFGRAHGEGLGRAESEKPGVP